MKKSVLVSAVASIPLLYSVQTLGANPVHRPNILIAISDDQSFIHNSFSGSDWIKTPAFDYIAGHGVFFTSCYAGSPGCAPSRSALITGRRHWQNEQAGQHWSEWPKKFVPFPDLLQKNGYETGVTGKGVAPFQYGDPWRKYDAAGPHIDSIRYGKQVPDTRTADGISPVDYFENFKAFMDHRDTSKPFYFWYGAHEPHRRYEKGSWKRNGKKLADVVVPGFLPDNDEIRGDMLDYAVEIEWFDSQLMKMIDYLRKIGELDNTIVIVTGDNGMPFPRAKAYCFEYGAHVPLAISYPNHFPANRVVRDPVDFSDLAPTILELTGTSSKGMLPIAGRSIANILESNKTGIVDPTKKYAFTGRERHSSSRYHNIGYPERAIRDTQYLFVWNVHPEYWPAGAPQRMKSKNPDVYYPMYGIDKNGKHHDQWAFCDIDPGPSKTYIIEHHADPAIKPFFDLAFQKRPEKELYDIKNDPFCLHNLSGKPEYAAVETRLQNALMDELVRTKDPRVVGPVKDIFDTYSRYGEIRLFPEPDWLHWDQSLNSY